MPSYNENILPTSTGLTLGTANQSWQAYISDAYANTIHSNTANAALSGYLRLASTDTIAWRNNANSSDVTLSKTGAASGTTPADTLVFNGSGIEGPFISNSNSPAAAGELRLASADAINFRNNANGADINGLSKNASDVVSIGGAAGIALTGPITTGTTISTGGLIVSAGGLTVSAGGAAVTGNSTVTGSLTATTFSSTGNVSIGGNEFITGLLTNYNGTATSGQGFGVIRQSVSQVTTSTNSTVTNMVPGASAGSYRVRFVMAVSAANTATLGWTLTWTDSNGTPQSPTNLSLFKSGTAAPALTFSAAAGDNYYGHADIDIDNSNATINAKVTFTGTSFTAKISVTFERLI